MTLNEVTISRAILEEQHQAIIDYLEMDAAAVGGGPSGLASWCRPSWREGESSVHSSRRNSVSAEACGAAG